MLESHGFPGDKTYLLTTKDRTPRAVTPAAFVAEASAVTYEFAKPIFASILHDSGKTFAIPVPAELTGHSKFLTPPQPL